MRGQLTAIVECEGDGYVALCPEVDVASQGDSAAEAQENLQEAIALFFEAASPEEIERRWSGGVYLTLVEEDFHLIDDPPEDEGGRGELEVADDPGQGVSARRRESHLARNTYLRGKAVVGSVDYSELKRDVTITVSAWSRASAGAIESTWSAGYRSSVQLAGAAVPQWRRVGP